MSSVHPPRCRYPLAKAVSVTLHPKGGKAIVEQGFGGPQITKDGGTVAKAITLNLRCSVSLLDISPSSPTNPSFSLFQDVAAQKMNEWCLIGSTVFTGELDIKLERATSGLLGSTCSVTITEEDGVFINGEGSKDSIQASFEPIQAVLNDALTSEYDKLKLKERLANLSGGVVVMNVGGSWREEGLHTWRLATPLLSRPQTQHLSPCPTSTKNSASSLSHALSPNLHLQFSNSGKESCGFDAQLDMIKSGIVDPLNVLRTSLMDAAGVASLLVTSDACIFEPEGKERPGIGGMGRCYGRDGRILRAEADDGADEDARSGFLFLLDAHSR
ncbi:hypothetical protein BD410DRAFT_900328 [Rickenella mellea]|uniref:Uncharacterized protein n=1 Tax=Rickenella mellea TaxID=50990 RepID=A0A4Y7PW83_9AGAM|nr:hypothetical protein BD410DRAFT_900328 [Rickenella mellea]